MLQHKSATFPGLNLLDNEQGRWHLIVGSRAQDVPFPNGGGTDYTKTDYPCDSRIIRAVSESKDPAGPYKLAEVIVN